MVEFSSPFEPIFPHSPGIVTHSPRNASWKTHD